MLMGGKSLARLSFVLEQWLNKHQIVIRNHLVKCFFISFTLVTFQYAQADVSANFGVSNRYVKRGVKVSNKDSIVFQGGLDYQSPWGFYAGGFLYNRDTREKDDWLEANLYTGWAYGFQDWHFGAGVIHYEFDGPSEAYQEYTASIGWRSLRFSTFQRDDGKERYYDLQYNAHIWENSGLLFGAGLRELEKTVGNETENKFYRSYRIGYLVALQSDVDFTAQIDFTEEKKRTIKDAVSFQATLTRRFSLF